MTLSNTLKFTAAAAVIGLAAAATTAPARADTIRTNCVGDSCIRVQCDDWGDNCVRIASYYRGDAYDRRDYTPYQTRYVCDADGDDCHWARVPIYYDRPADEDDYYGD